MYIYHTHIHMYAFSLLGPLDRVPPSRLRSVHTFTTVLATSKESLHVTDCVFAALAFRLVPEAVHQLTLVTATWGSMGSFKGLLKAPTREINGQIKDEGLSTDLTALVG